MYMKKIVYAAGNCVCIDHYNVMITVRSINGNRAPVPLFFVLNHSAASLSCNGA